ncbi:MAG: 2-oxoacid:acceptor oxidoreductase family protein, partial [Anaerolineales bacterium]|nr:2-oxoacid:acceptor oxidoreductase family protein [Anaerolineales bacterium]
MPVASKIVNDFSITIATVNGSGSQTANTIILRALFKMGIPVSGKNLFPSNIQGLPTWYTIRVNKDGFIARRDEHEIVVSINPASFARDLAQVLPGGAFFYIDDIKLPLNRADISLYPMPVKQLASVADVSPKLRDYIANMVYVGVLAQILGIDLEKIRQALAYHFGGSAKAVESNFATVKAAADWTAANLTKNDPYFVEPMDRTSHL